MIRELNLSGWDLKTQSLRSNKSATPELKQERLAEEQAAGKCKKFRVKLVSGGLEST